MSWPSGRYWLNLIAHALWNFSIPAYLVLGPVIAATRLGGASAWGAISAAWAVAGGIIALRAHPRRPLVAGNLALVLSVLPLLALARPLATWEIGIPPGLGGCRADFPQQCLGGGYAGADSRPDALACQFL